MVKYLLSICLLSMIVVFQNCTDQSFSQKTDANKALSIDGSEEIVIDEVPNVIAQQGSNSNQSQRGDDDDDGNGNSTNEVDDEGDNYSNSAEPPTRERNCKNRKDGNGKYLCVLAGPGRSQHVAVINDAIVDSNSTPKSACMSYDACQYIVGAKMEVKSIESRGFCKNGTPQVLVFTDAEVQALVDKMM